MHINTQFSENFRSMSSSEDHVDDGEDVDLINNAMEGNLNEVRALSRAGANVNAQRDSDGATALIVASGNGHVDVVESLLQGVRIDVNLQRTNDLNLIKNALKGNYKKVRDLLHHGANVNAHNDGGETALMSASKRNHEKVVDLLLEQSHVDVNAQDSNGATALVVASSRGYVEVVRSLLRHNKVDANLPMNDGRTALTVVSDKGSTALHAAKQKALLRMFQDHGETLKAVEKDRALLPNVMTTKNAVPIELTYQYIKRYDTNRKLRSGDFRDVFLAEDSDLPEPKRFVVKMIKLSHRCDESLASFQKELLVRSIFCIECLASCGTMNNGPISLEF
jgi:ankyrin repeat protein